MEAGEARLKILMDGWREDRLSAEEMNELSSLLEKNDVNQPLSQLLLEVWEHTPEKPKDTSPHTAEMIRRIISANTDESNLRKPFFGNTVWMRNAAIFLLILGAAMYLFLNKSGNQHPSAVVSKAKATILPGSNGAILTLADGSTVVLDSLQNGAVVHQTGAEVLLKDGQLSYNQAGNSPVTYNTLTTPKGRSFRLMLPDGTKVWLNAASSIRYPTAFTGANRDVDIRGEVYFEVEGRPSSPFRVKVGNLMNVEVLGTRFNINAYDDEPTAKMTLVQGSVKLHPLNKPGEGIVMQPGEQAILSDRSLSVQQVDPAGSIAWVRGVFQLQGVDMKTAMRQIARWYNIEVVFKDDINPRLAGSAYQSEGLQDLLKVIGYASDVKFAVSDKTVFVMKK